MIALMAQSVPTTLVRLSGVDIGIIVFYFGLVPAIGLYLRRRSNTGEDFFMAGREMTAWIAGLSFFLANLRSLELMGWAASARPGNSSGSLSLPRQRLVGRAVAHSWFTLLHQVCSVA